MLLISNKISPFGELIKKIKIAEYRLKMRFPTKPFANGNLAFKPSPLQPVLPLIPDVLPTKDQDKSKFVSFELKVRAGQAAGSTTYKKFVRVFEEGTPQQWIDLVRDVEEIWIQNSINGPTDRMATIHAILKGESLTAFEVALEDARVDPAPNAVAPLALTVAHIGLAMDAVAAAVFPHRALEIQRLWMNRGMKKPMDLSTRKTAAAITRINNALPLFPLGTPEAKFSDQELVGLLEWSLPQAWRKKFDLDGYIPTLGTKAKLILECEAIERNESAKDNKRSNDNDNNKKFKKNKFDKSRGATPKDDRFVNGSFFCKNCGPNRTHVTSKCWYLKNKLQRASAKEFDNNQDIKKQDRPFSRRTFKKEVNSLARKAGKKKALGLYAAALKRQQTKESDKNKKNKKNNESDDSSESSGSVSIHNLEKPIPRKKVYDKVVNESDKTNKTNKKKEDSMSDDDYAFLDNVNKMQIADDYEMVDSNDDVVSLNDDDL